MTEQGYLISTSIIAGLAIIALVGWHLVLVLWADYRIGRHEVQVLLFDRVVRHVPLSDIDDAVPGIRLPAEFWPAPALLRGRFLSIRKKHGLLRYLVICPRHPDRFRRNLYFTMGWDPDAS